MKLSHKPKKSLGQNFLIDKNIIKKIVKIVETSKNKNVMEIGGGYGNLTLEISKLNLSSLYVVEKDKNLSFILRDKFKHNKNIKVINDDFLNINKKNISEKKITIVGNLPYNLSTKILSTLILLEKWPPWYDKLVFMFQKEVADRIIATNKKKEFGRLAVLSNWRLEVTKHFDISNNCFLPKPKVDSTLLSFEPKEKNYLNLKNPKNLETITRILFSSRRKMINKSFKKLFKNSTTIAQNLNLNLKLRPEELDNETFYKIAQIYENLTN